MLQTEQEEFFDFYYWYENHCALSGRGNMYFIGKSKTNQDKYILLADTLQRQHIYVQYLAWKREQEILQKQQEQKLFEDVKQVAEKAIEDTFYNVKLG